MSTEKILDLKLNQKELSGWTKVLELKDKLLHQKTQIERLDREILILHKIIGEDKIENLGNIRIIKSVISSLIETLSEADVVQCNNKEENLKILEELNSVL
jgi:hypothetical protein